MAGTGVLREATVTDAAAILGTWDGRDVRLDDVLDALDGLRHSSEKRATRTSVMNLVVVARSDEDLLTMTERIRAIPGIRSTETLVYLALRKETYYWGR